MIHHKVTSVYYLSENLSQSSVQESPADVQVATNSLSVSLSHTRGLLSELSEFLNQPKVPVKAKGKTTKARVLTSAESLSLLIEKERRKSRGGSRGKVKRGKQIEKEVKSEVKLRTKETKKWLRNHLRLKD